MDIAKQTKYTLYEGDIKIAIRRYLIDAYLGSATKIKEEDIVIDGFCDEDGKLNELKATYFEDLIQEETKLIHSKGYLNKDTEQQFIYLLSSDGHKDSTQLDRGSLNIEGLKKLLIDVQKSVFDYDILKDSIKIEDKGTYGWLHFKYRECIEINEYCDDEIEDGKCGFFKLNIV